MGFAGARPADEDGVALGIQESAGSEFAQLALIDRRVGEEEAVEILQYGELRTTDAVADGSRLPVGALCPDQAGEEGIELIAAGKTLAGDLVEAGAHTIKLEFTHGIEKLMA